LGDAKPTWRRQSYPKSEEYTITVCFLKMQPNITNRIVADSRIPRLFPVLAEELPASDLQSLLLAVYRSRARTIRESGVVARAERSTLVVPSSVDARLLNAFDQAAFAAADGFQAVDLDGRFLRISSNISR
jgi:hypothetical protein